MGKVLRFRERQGAAIPPRLKARTASIWWASSRAEIEEPMNEWLHTGGTIPLERVTASTRHGKFDECVAQLQGHIARGRPVIFFPYKITRWRQWKSWRKNHPRWSGLRKKITHRPRDRRCNDLKHGTAWLFGPRRDFRRLGYTPLVRLGELYRGLRLIFTNRIIPREA